jgi:hypothetical protein
MKSIAIKIRKSWKIMEIITTLEMLMLFLKLKLQFRQKLKSLIEEN